MNNVNNALTDLKNTVNKKSPVNKNSDNVTDIVKL